MKIRSVKSNNRRKAFEAAVAKKRLLFPFARLEYSERRCDNIRMSTVRLGSVNLPQRVPALIRGATMDP
jgi:hypothetical protein